MPDSNILKRLRRNVSGHDFNEEQIRAFIKSDVYGKLDEYLEDFGTHLSELTIDSAVEEIINLKNSELAKARSQAFSKSESKKPSSSDPAALQRKIAELEFRVAYARSFRYLIGTFCERVMEKLGLRRAPTK